MDWNLLSTAAVALLAFVVIQRRMGGRNVSTQVVKEKLDSGAVIVDVRTPEEFRTGAYPGAKNIPLSELGQRLAEIPKDRTVVLYCASGMRSATAAQVMRRAGFADVVNAGGLSAMPR